MTGAATDLLGSGTTAAYLLSLRILMTATLIVMAGVLLARGEDGGQQATLTRLNSRIFIPCLIFSSLNLNPLTLSDMLIMSGGAVLFAACCYPLACWSVARDPQGGSSGFIPLLIGSSDSLLLPLSFLLFGSQGLAKATFFHLANLLLYSTWGMKYCGQPIQLAVFLKTPALHAVFLALILNLFNFDFPQQVQELFWLIEKGIGMLGFAALPMLLMSHGYALFCLRAAGASCWSSVGLIRALWLPLVALLLIITLRISGVAPLDKGYDLMRYLDLRTSEAILLLAAALPCSIAISPSPAGAPPHSRRTAAIVLSSSLLSIVVFAILISVINRYIYHA